tara:strand:- start:224 stop:472 length:249 start_codon:yes stop_codon:yes gene_type:complete
MYEHWFLPNIKEFVIWGLLADDMWVGIGITWKLSVVMLASLGHWNQPMPIGITATTLGINSLGIIGTGRSNQKTLDFKLDSG